MSEMFSPCSSLARTFVVLTCANMFHTLRRRVARKNSKTREERKEKMKEVLCEFEYRHARQACAKCGLSHRSSSRFRQKSYRSVSPDVMKHKFSTSYFSLFSYKISIIRARYLLPKFLIVKKRFPFFPVFFANDFVGARRRAKRIISINYTRLLKRYLLPFTFAVTS